MVPLFRVYVVAGGAGLGVQIPRHTFAGREAADEYRSALEERHAQHDPICPWRSCTVLPIDVIATCEEAKAIDEREALR